MPAKLSISGSLTLTASLLCSTASFAQNAYIPDYSEANANFSAAPEFVAAGISSGGMAYSNITVIDTKTNQVVTTIPVQLNPYGVDVSPDGSTVWVVSQSVSIDQNTSRQISSGELTKIDTATNKVTGLFSPGEFPYGVAVTPDNKKIYITHAGDDSNGNPMNSVNTINPANSDNNKNISICCQPYGIVITPDGTKAYVGDFGSNNVSVIDTTKDAVVATIAVPNTPFEVAVSPDGTRVYVASQSGNAVYVIDTATNKLVQTISTPAPLTVAVSADNSKIYVGNTSLNANNTVSVFNAGTYKLLSTFAASYPWGFGVTPDGTKLITVDANGGSAIITNAGNNQMIATVRVGIEPLAFGVPVQPPAAPKFAGVPGTVSCVTTSEQTAIDKSGGLDQAISASGYPNAVAWQTAIWKYCSGEQLSELRSRSRGDQD